MSEWGVWVLVVLCLISYGILIGHDVTQLSGISNALTAIGTLMLGIAALIAIPVWKDQEKVKFQAKVAANLHAELSIVRQQFRTPTFLVQSLFAVNDRGTDYLADIVFETKLKQTTTELESEIHNLLKVIETSVLSKVPLLGAEYTKRAQILGYEYSLLVTEPWTAESVQKHSEMLQLLDELIAALASKALFQR